MKLNLGCGEDIKEGWVNIDRVGGPGIDMVVELRGPLPLADGVAEEVLASHILEHLPEWETLVVEVGRVLRPGGIFIIKVPYMSFEGQHLRQFDKRTMNVFIWFPRTKKIGSGSAGLDQFVLFEKVSFEARRERLRIVELIWVLKRL